MPRSRITLDLSSRSSEALDLIARKRDCTKADALRMALSLMFSFEEAKEQGLHIGAWRQDGNTRIEREFIVGI